MGRLPGISFETVPLPLADGLPRMDVAAFVGFAQAGPVDVPVPIEDVGRFRDLYGNDPDLAWDAERGRMERGHLGPAVEAFFDGGGRRCWIVRVAEGAYTHVFDLPGLVGTSTDLEHPTRAQARAPGAWASDLSVGTTLIATLMSPASGEGGSGWTADPPLVIETANERAARGEDPAPRLVLGVRAAPGEIVRGDLIEARLLPTQVRVFLVADTVDLIDGGVRIVSRIPAPQSPRPRQVQWAVGAARSSIDEGSDFSDHLDLLRDAEGVDALREWRSQEPGTGSPPWRPSLEIRRLTFQITVWREGRFTHSMEDLAFSPEHARFWARLPDDEELFRGLPEGRGRGRLLEIGELTEEAAGERGASGRRSSERFPLAGPHGVRQSVSLPLYLPSRMALAREAGFTVGAGESPPPPGRRDQDGLIPAPEKLFFDDRLDHYSGDDLLRSAERLNNAARESWLRGRKSKPLRGLHALLPIEEVTMVAVPDAVHRSWSSDARVIEHLLPAPWLDRPRGRGPGDAVDLEWSVVSEATAYRLEGDISPEFTSAIAAYEGDKTTALVLLPPSCARQWYFRVRALRYAELSAWSNTRALREAPGEFLSCGKEDLPELTLAMTEGSPPDEPARLRWWATTEPAMPAGATRFRLQIAQDALFGSARDAALSETTELALPGQRDAVEYYRVRAESADGAGPWSNAIIVLPNSASQPTLVPLESGAGFDDAPLLAVHRALTRFSAARGDLVGLLSLPRHYGARDALGHLAALSPDETASELTFAAGRRGSSPLTAGEAPSLSYVALLYPWTARRVGNAGRLVGRDASVAAQTGEILPRFVPPEGAVAGLLARQALDEGPWLAAGNRPLAGVLALDPDFDDADAEALVRVQVNLLRRDPRGFVLANDETLGRDADTRPLSVRRLLILIKRLALREGNTYVFEPFASDFAGRVRHRFQRILSNLHLRRAFQGRTADEAFRVVVDETVNPPQSFDLGRFVVELRVAPSRPLSFLRVRLTQSGTQEIAVGEG